VTHQGIQADRRDSGDTASAGTLHGGAEPSRNAAEWGHPVKHSRIARAVFWMVWSRGGIQLLSFVGTLLVARLLSPSDYGLMAIAGIWTGFVTLLAEMGLGAAIVQFRDLEERELNSCFWLTMGISTVGYVVLYVASPTLATWFENPMLTEILRVAGLSLPLVAVRIVPDSLLRKQLAFDKISKAEIVAALSAVPVMIGMAGAGAGVWSLVAGGLLVPFVQTAVSFWYVRWRPGLQIGGRQYLQVVKYSLNTLGSKLGWAAYQQADVFVLGKVSGDIVLGFYSMAMALASLPVEKVSVVVNQLASPLMAELQTDREGMRAAFLRSTRMVASATFPLCLGLMLVAEDLVRVALTDKWLPVVPVLQVLCLYAVIQSVIVLFPHVLLACYRARFLFAHTVALIAIMPLAFWAGAKWWGAMGVAAAWVLVYPIVLTWLAHEALQEIGVSWKMLGTQLWPPVAATLVMVGTMLLVRVSVSSWGEEASVGRLAVMSLAGASAYGLVLLRIGGPVVAEIKEVVGWVLRGNRAASACRSGAL
jgi:O-antigen/teichoic acid export membrane protein